MKSVMIVFLLFFVTVAVINAKPHGSAAMEKGNKERKSETVVIQRQHAPSIRIGENAILLQNDEEDEECADEGEDEGEDEGDDSSIKTNITIAAATKYFAKLFTELDALKAKDKALEASISSLIPESQNHQLDALKAKVSTLTSDVATLKSENAALASVIKYFNPSNGDVRLVDSKGNFIGVGYGRLEVFHKKGKWTEGEWGTVCDDGNGKDGSSSVQGNNNMATVVCQMLGYGGDGGTVYNKAGLGKGTGKIWLDEVRCTGNERRLFDCPHSGIGSHDCRHDEDVGIDCILGLKEYDLYDE